MRWSTKHGCYRATATDPEYGPSCPECAAPKDDQALLCKGCRNEAQRLPDYWDRRTCACGGEKSPYRPKCMVCEYERRRQQPHPRDEDGMWVAA